MRELVRISVRWALRDAIEQFVCSSKPYSEKLSIIIPNISHVLNSPGFGPRTKQIIDRLILKEKDGVIYMPDYGPLYGKVSASRAKEWIKDLIFLYSWQCFLLGQNEKDDSWFEDRVSVQRRRSRRKISDS